MSPASIFLHAEGPPDLETSDPSTVEALRKAFPFHTNRFHIHAHELEGVLLKLRPLWARTMEGFEEAHMVTVEIED